MIFSMFAEEVVVDGTLDIVLVEEDWLDTRGDIYQELVARVKDVNVVKD